MKIAYIGGFGKTYDLETVIEAVRRNLDFELEVAGGGCFGFEHERVTFRGFLGEAALAEMLERCDVGVIPMPDDSWVGLPNKMFDYAKAGLPIVSSLTGESAELLRRYGCGMTFVSGDAESLAKAIRSAAKLPHSSSFKMCEELFSARSIYDGYVRFATVIGANRF